MQPESSRQRVKRFLYYLPWLLTKLAVEGRIIVRTHPTLEYLGINGSVKEARRDT
jgi:hypothetical protein